MTKTDKTRPSWYALATAYAVAKTEDDAINEQYDDALKAYEAELPAEPDIDFQLLGLVILGHFPERQRRDFMRVDDLDEWQAKIIGATNTTRWEKVNRDAERIAEIDKVRAYRAEVERIAVKHDIDRLNDAWEATAEKLSDVRFEMIRSPAPDYTAVQWKLEQLFGPEACGNGGSTPCWDSEHTTDIVRADMARLNAEFAEAWLTAFQKEGGSVIMVDGGSAMQIGWKPEAPDRFDEGSMDEQSRSDRNLMADYSHWGVMRAMSNMLSHIVPGGNEMVKQHLRDAGQAYRLPRDTEEARPIGEIVAGIVDALPVEGGVEEVR